MADKLKEARERAQEVLDHYRHDRPETVIVARSGFGGRDDWTPSFSKADLRLLLAQSEPPAQPVSAPLADVGEGERIAPVQGYAPGIPWEMHLRAYAAYCDQYRPQPALIQGNCRGGFSTEELDDFIPGWREELPPRATLATSPAAPLSAEVVETIGLTEKVAERFDFLADQADAIVGIDTIVALTLRKEAVALRTLIAAASRQQLSNGPASTPDQIAGGKVGD